MTHPATVYSLSTRLLHWSMAFCFIGAIVLAYFVIWVLGHDHPQRLPVLNLHWVLGLLVGLLLILGSSHGCAGRACQRSPARRWSTAWRTTRTCRCMP